MNKTNAFTIIELLLVIAIMGIISTFGVSLYQKHVENQKITIAAQRMEQIIQAIETYYEQNKEWPPDEQLARCIEGGTSEICSYLPQAILKDPWDNIYEWAPPKGYPNFYLIYSQAYTNQALAQKIAQQLPNAEVTRSDEVPNGHIITARIGTPGQVLGKSKVIFGGVDTITNNKPIANYSCPPHTTPQFSPLLHSLDPRIGKKSPIPWQIDIIDSTLTSPPSFTLKMFHPLDLTHWIPIIKNFPDQPGFSYTYFVSCQPDNPI